MSPDLFSIYINDLIARVQQSKKTIEVDNDYIGMLMYADDATIMCEDNRKLQQVLDIIVDYCDQHQIMINAKKNCSNVYRHRR